MTKNCPRVLISATSSGSGKTTAVCAILTLLKRRGTAVASCKCGPDYIDPMFHKSVLGIGCTNLDPFFCGDDLLRYLLCENAGRDFTVIEGVMGYYDGTGSGGVENSTYTVARATTSTVILVINARGASTSLLPVIEGFLNFQPDSNIKGVIFNQISPMTYESLKKLMKARFGNSVVPVGYIPKLPEDCILGSRHLGLITAGEISDLNEKLNKIADLCESSIDIDALINIGRGAGEIQCAEVIVPKFDKIKIAVALDSAFCFYYKDTLRLFEKMGAEIVPFSPLKNEPVPAEADGLLLGGGYPELYAETLQNNTVSASSVKNSVERGMPTIAECGGFQYLGEKLNGFSMCGVLSHESCNTGKLVRFGYVTLTPHMKNLLGPARESLCAHEFHYYDSTDNGNTYTARKSNGKSWECVVSTDTLYAGYPHLYLYANLPSAEAYYKKCLEYKIKKEIR